jgi:release factor glutamine methyltransferase
VNRREALAKARELLTDNDIEDAALEGEILLRHVLGISRAQLFAELDSDISQLNITQLLKLVERRIKGEPSAYIIGIKEFYGLVFNVNRHVLIPRPETELLVDQSISLCRKYHYSKVADIGTGCGAIAVSLAKNLPDIKIYATDISSSALKVAKQNCVKHNVKDRVTLLKGDMLKPLPEPVDLIIANLPYVIENDIPEKGLLSYEPRKALDGGKEGLDKISELCRQSSGKLNKGGSILLEVGQGQAAFVKLMIMDNFLSGSVEVLNDLAGIERVVYFRLTYPKRQR